VRGRAQQFVLREDEIKFPDGAEAMYAVVESPDSAFVVPYFGNGDTMLVRQWRHAWDISSWEVPAGTFDGDEDALTCARRELAEETGLVAAEWREVLWAQLSNSITDERAVGFVALGLSEAPHGHEKDETEDLAIVRVPFREALEAALAGHLQDVLTVAMLLRAYHMAREGSLPDALVRVMLG